MTEEEEEVDYDFNSPEKPLPAAEDQAPGEDIYGDLYDEHGEGGTLLKSKYAALEEKCKNLEATVEALKRQVADSSSQNDTLQEEKRILVRNISCLYKTAKENISLLDNSIATKNEEILRLQLALKGSGTIEQPKLPKNQSPGNNVVNSAGPILDVGRPIGF